MKKLATIITLFVAVIVVVAANAESDVTAETRKVSRSASSTITSPAINSVSSTNDGKLKQFSTLQPTRPPVTAYTAAHAQVTQPGSLVYPPLATGQSFNGGYVLQVPTQTAGSSAATSPLLMQYGVQYVQLLPRPVMLPINPYQVYQQPQTQSNLPSHQQVQLQYQPQQQQQQQQQQPFLPITPTSTTYQTNQQAPTISLVQPNNHYHHQQQHQHPQHSIIGYNPLQLQSPHHHYHHQQQQQQPPLPQHHQQIASYSNQAPVLSYYAAQPQSRLQLAAGPLGHLTLNTNEYMPAQLENGFRAIKHF